MGKIVLDITMSLDGFVTAPNDDVGRGLSDEGECLHNWVFGGEWVYGGETGSAIGADRDVLDEMFASAGAVVLGRRLFEVADGWGDDPPFGVPCFVLTHRGREKLVKGATTFIFVTDGIDSALEQAKAVAGDKDVSIGGGANIAQQYLNAGLVDEAQIHLAPVLLGAGTRLFDGMGAERVGLERTRVIESPFATHLRFRVVK